jgi:hypothetical protein
MKTLMVLLVVCSMVACAGNVKAPIGLEGRKVKCQPDLSGCMMEAAQACPHGFIMNLQEGGIIAPTVQDWQPSKDGWFHILLFCN